MEEMTPMERVMKTLKHEEPDRVPVLFIALTIGASEAGVEVREYATNGKAMARGQLNFLRNYRVDGLMPMSDVASFADAFGCVSKFFDGKLQTPVIAQHVVKDWRDWEKLEVIDPTKDGRIPPMLEACRILKDELGDSVPVVGMAPSPITWATWLQDMGGVMKDVLRHPDELKRGLTVIAESSAETGRAFLAAGADAIMMAVTRCSREILTPRQYEEFGKPYDLHVLNSLKDKAPLMLHVCGVYPMLDLLADSYPVVAINWWDRGTATSLREAKQRFGDKVALVGGLDQTRELLTGTPEEVEAQTKDAIEQAARGGGFILSGGCELSAISPPENIHAVVRAAEKYGRYPIAL